MRSDRIGRHDALRNVLFAIAKQAGLNPRMEERSLLPQEGREFERPGDIVIPNWAQGHHGIWDVTVISPLQKYCVKRAAEQSGVELTLRWKSKMAKSYDTCKAKGFEFLPLPVSTMGGWHPEASKAISKLGGALAAHTGKEKSVVVAHLFQRLSVALIKGNGALVLSRVPRFPSPEVDGDLDREEGEEDLAL